MFLLTKPSYKKVLEMNDPKKSALLLKHHLKQLKLPTMTAECEKIAARAAKDNLDHLDFLLQLCELELLDRERRAGERRLKAAKFPASGRRRGCPRRPPTPPYVRFRIRRFRFNAPVAAPFRAG
jgi:hypothetical protein